MNISIEIKIFKMTVRIIKKCVNFCVHIFDSEVRAELRLKTLLKC